MGNRRAPEESAPVEELSELQGLHSGTVGLASPVRPFGPNGIRTASDNMLQIGHQLSKSQDITKLRSIQDERST
jgi:hypothetical protein